MAFIRHDGAGQETEFFILSETPPQRFDTDSTAAYSGSLGSSCSSRPSVNTVDDADDDAFLLAMSDDKLRRAALTGSGTRRASWSARLVGFSKQVSAARKDYDTEQEAEHRNIAERDSVIHWWCHQTLTRFLLQIAKRPQASAFLEPVPWEKEQLGITDYPEVIANPIDLRTIGYRLEDGHYSDGEGYIDPEAFWEDVSMCWSNCCKYFEGDIEVEAVQMALDMRAFAEHLEDQFTAKLDKFEKALEELNPMLASAAAIADVAADALEDAASIAYEDSSTVAGVLMNNASDWWQGDEEGPECDALQELLKSVGCEPWPHCFISRMSVFRSVVRTVPTSLIHSEQAVRLLSPLANSLGGAFSSMSMPSGVHIQRDTVRGIEGEWLLPEGFGELGASRMDSLLIWAHGGGFILCSPTTHRFFLAHVVTQCDVPVFSVDYRKPPDHPFPTPVDDIFNVYEALRERDLADHIFLGGDSAGGNLVLSATRGLCWPQGAIQHQGPPLPDGLVLLSPWVDLSDTSQDSWARYADVDYIPCQHAKAVAHIYSNGIPLEDQELSPGLCERWPDSFPPVLLDYGGCEVFRSQIDRLAKSMAEDGLDIDVSVEAGMVHCYPLLENLWGPDPGPFEAYFERVATFIESVEQRGASVPATLQPRLRVEPAL